MDKFLKNKIEPINIKQTYNIEVEENKVSIIDIVETNDKEKTNIELEQESIKYEENLNPTFINNDIELSFVNHSKHIEGQVSYLENIIENSDDRENLNMCSKNEGETMNNIKNIKFNCGSPKIETNIMEIDMSKAPKNRKCVVVETSLDQIKQRLKLLSSQISGKQKMKTRFYATIDPSKNQQAESELSREISKDMFSQVNKNYFRFK